MKSLLVCIAYHQDESSRIDYLQKIINRFKSYEMDVHIIIDTNKDLNIDTEVHVHKNLPHPYHLTWMHRNHFYYHIDNYEWFMYIEDDMDVPFENFQLYMENFKLLWPDYIPAFVRVETLNGKEYNVDNLSPQSINLIKIGDKEFTTIGNPYHAFWIMPKNQLKWSIIENENYFDFNRSRESAASYPNWILCKTPLLMIENGQVSPLCYSYHLSNKYVESDSPFGKVEMKDLLYYKKDNEIVKDVIINKRDDGINRPFLNPNYVVK